MNTFKGYVPALINTTQKKQIVKENNFALLLTIENTEALSTTLKLPFTMVQPGRITGHYNNIYNKVPYRGVASEVQSREIHVRIRLLGLRQSER